MDTKANMIIIKGKVKTSEIDSCKYNSDTERMDVQFNNGKTYSYACSNVEWLVDPHILNPEMYRINRNGQWLFNITSIYVFEVAEDVYWHICFVDITERDYLQSDQ